MSMNYFTPADLQQVDATYNFTARAGLGFAITQENEQVFISAQDVKRYNLEVGDAMRVWATDNYASPHTAHHPSRWRAVRVEVVSRVTDIVSVAPNVPAPAAQRATDFVGVFTSVLEQLRPWTVQALTQAIAKQSVPLSGIPDLIQKVGGRLSTMHKNGEVAALKVYASGDQQIASTVYYAKNVNVFYEHLDTPLSDEE
jgi:hypothetical protein